MDSMRSFFTALILSCLAAVSVVGVSTARPVSAPVAPQASGMWQRINATSYVFRAESKTGAFTTPKLVPPAGVNVLAQFVAGGQAGNSCTWSNTGATNYVPSAFATTTTQNFLILRLQGPSGLVGTTGTAFLTATPRYFDMDSVYAPGAGGTDQVLTSLFAGGGGAFWPSDGNYISASVLSTETAGSPSPLLTVTSSGTYSVDIFVSW